MSISSREEDDEDILDTSWIENEEFRSVYEKESMTELVLFFVYMNRDMVIEFVIKDYIDIDDGVISKEQLLHIIQSRRHRSDVAKKYKFMDLMAFHVPLEPDELEGFVVASPEKRFMKTLPMFDSVVIDPSIFIFHDLNSLFFFFREFDSSPPSSSGSGSRAVTKKIRLDAFEYIDKKRKSLKRMLRGGSRSTRKIGV
jgi:hypothetical protein